MHTTIDIIMIYSPGKIIIVSTRQTRHWRSVCRGQGGHFKMINWGIMQLHCFTLGCGWDSSGFWTLFHSCTVSVSPFTNLLEKIGSVYPIYVYDCNRPLTPILKQKMALSGVWSLLTADVWCLQDQNTWNTFPGSGLNIYQIIQILNKRIEFEQKHCIEWKHWIKQEHWTKVKHNNWQ